MAELTSAMVVQYYGLDQHIMEDIVGTTAEMCSKAIGKQQRHVWRGHCRRKIERRYPYDEWISKQIHEQDCRLGALYFLHQ